MGASEGGYRSPGIGGPLEDGAGVFFGAVLCMIGISSEQTIAICATWLQMQSLQLSSRERARAMSYSGRPFPKRAFGLKESRGDCADLHLPIFFCGI